MIVLFCSASLPNITAQNIDSLLLTREAAYAKYIDYKENIGERTWIKLVELSNLAHELITIDKTLASYYQENGIGQTKTFKHRIEELNLEISLLKREADMQRMMLEEKNILFNTLLKILGGISLIFIGLLIFAIDRHVRFRNVRMELERTWAGEIEPPKQGATEEDFSKVNQEIKLLSKENSKLKNQVVELMKKISEKEKILDEELQSRAQLKEEIRNLIAQIKSQ
jgi:hypothetical protein